MTKSKEGAAPKRGRAPRNWRPKFLAALADTSNVTAAAEQAGISQSWVYKLRRDEPEFAREWLVALCDGYDRLEMDLLHRLRTGESRDAAGAKHDNAMAIRLLTMHRGDVARGRALRDNDDEETVLESIDAMIDAMRERSAANAQTTPTPAASGDDEASGLG